AAAAARVLLRAAQEDPEEDARRRAAVSRRRRRQGARAHRPRGVRARRDHTAQLEGQLRLLRQLRARRGVVPSSQTLRVADEDLPMQRIRAIDWLRGLVMMLMTIDHAGDIYDAHHYMTDGAFMWKPGSIIPTGEFLTRWLTHLCAPSFVLLAGTS